MTILCSARGLKAPPAGALPVGLDYPQCVLLRETHSPLAPWTREALVSKQPGLFPLGIARVGDLGPTNAIRSPDGRLPFWERPSRALPDPERTRRVMRVGSRLAPAVKSHRWKVVVCRSCHDDKDYLPLKDWLRRLRGENDPREPIVKVFRAARKAAEALLAA